MLQSKLSRRKKEQRILKTVEVFLIRLCFLYYIKMCELVQCKGTSNHGKLFRISIFICIIVTSPCLSKRLEFAELSDHNADHMCNIAYKRGNFTDLTAQTVQMINSRLFKINVTNNGYVSVGERFVVECYAEQNVGVFYAPKLLTPISDRERVEEECYYPATDDPYKKSCVWRKIIKNAQKEDEGNYSCIMDDGSTKQPTRSHLIKVFGSGEYFLDVSAEKNNITDPSGKTAKWIMTINGFPLNFTKELRRNDNQEEKIQASLTKIGMWRFKLEINNVALQDMGPYKFYIYLNQHPHENITLDLHLTVNSPPIVKIESEVPTESPINCKFGHACIISCKVEANPPPESYWTWQKCNSGRSCEASIKIPETHKKQIDHGFISSIEFNGTHHGNYTCHAKNIQKTPKEVSITKQIRIVDYPGAGAITIIKPEEVVEGDDLKLISVASKLGYDENITWVQADGTTAKPVDQAKFTTEETQWSRRITMEIKNIEHSATGTYRCTTGGSSPKLEASYHLEVLSIASPQFLDSTNLNNSKISLKLGESKALICNVTGRPRPVVTWIWNTHSMREWGNVRELKELKYSLSEDARILLLKYVPAESQGRFQCKAQNRNGTATAFLDVTLKGSQIFSNMALAIIIALLLVLTICGAILARYKYKQGKLDRFLKEINQKEFYDGDVDKINPDISVSDQAYLLPYDKRFEFPSARLKLGIQLGAGAFGRVVKADATGILNEGQNTTVAVKMMNPGADESHFKALMSELKIMIHLEKHANVVSLLGACTKSLAKKKELFVIVEYCKYGSLLSYLHRNKRNFINQLDPISGGIDSKIDQRNDRNQLQAQRTLHYAELTFMDHTYYERPGENGYRALKEFCGSNPQGLINESGVPVQETEFRHVYSELCSSEVGSFSSSSDSSSGPVITEGTTKRAESYESPWQDHYKGDYQGQEAQPIRTTDLLCWAFQISRGMEFLASKKVLHGDLAARNVLLDENKVVKICDFGMAKELYKDYKYKKNTNGVPLPLKWMAIESIFSGIFSTQSDCWSFGVVLWELFTLGQTPYPGMEADAKLFELISEGYRMEKPKLAPCNIYNIMLECWNQEPTERPTFSTLFDRIGDMLGKTENKQNKDELSPNAKYQNVPNPKELGLSGYFIPEMPPVSPLSLKFLEHSSSTPQYETSYSDSFIHQPRLEAQNPMYGILNLSNPPEEPREEMELQLHENKNELQLKQPPTAVKDTNNSCMNSYSTEIEIKSDQVVLKYGDYANIKVGDNGIKGVTNINYVSKHNVMLKKYSVMGGLLADKESESNKTNYNGLDFILLDDHNSKYRNSDDNFYGSLGTSST